MKINQSRRQLLRKTGVAAGAITATGALSAPAAAHGIGDPAYTTADLNIRSGPGLDYGVIETADDLTGLQVIGGPQSADGYTWWEFQVNGDPNHYDYYTGWAVEQYTDHADFSYPANGQIISTYYSPRSDGDHRAIDIGSDYGSPVTAAAPGTVTQTNYDPPYGCGKYIEITHAGSYITRYCHLADIQCSDGKWVNRGEIIGTMGNSGCDCVTHLHFRIMRYDDSESNSIYWPMDMNARVWRDTGIEKNFPGI